jgi:hypothetical protein
MKKNIFIFIAGMITMVLIEFIIGFIIGVFSQTNGSYPGLTLFEQDGACISPAKKIEIFQTFEPDIALAHTKKRLGSSLELDDILILILGDVNANFYDEQEITIPNGKCIKQVGTYQYKAKNDVMKTVPAVEIK